MNQLPSYAEPEEQNFLFSHDYFHTPDHHPLLAQHCVISSKSIPEKQTGILRLQTPPYTDPDGPSDNSDEITRRGYSLLQGIPAKKLRFYRKFHPISPLLRSGYMTWSELRYCLYEEGEGKQQGKGSR